MSTDKFIDIDQVIAAKSPRLLKLLPRFVIRYLKRIIHQDALNAIIEKYGHTNGAEFIGLSLNEMGVHYTAQGLENVPRDGRYLFASNHPLGGLDGMVLIHLIGSKFGEVKFPVNDFLMHVQPLHTVFVPVNKVGAQTEANVRLLDQAFASNAQMLYFPAGLCSRKQKRGVIEDLEWKKSFVTKVVQHKRNVVPVFFDGRNSNFFYNLARFRKFIGFKFNVEMLYLVDEMFKQKDKPIHVRFGKPIPYQTFDQSKSPRDWAAWVKHLVYAMASTKSI